MFAPVIGHDSVRCLLSLAASLDMEIHHMDIKTAFLNSILDSETSPPVFMTQPPGFAQPGAESLVCKLRKTIYGLRQSPKLWNSTLHTFLVSQGFTRSVCDFGVYFRRSPSHGPHEIIAVFVDDLMIFAPTVPQIDRLKALISSRFDTTDLG